MLMIRRLLLTLAASLLLAPSAAALDVHLVNLVHMPASEVRSLEWSLTVQANTQLAPVWATPQIRFVTSPVSWPIYLTYRGLKGDLARHGSSYLGYHAYDPTFNRPYAVVNVLGDDQVPMVISHELIEMLVDPSTNETIAGTLAEACDPVTFNVYRVGRWHLADFVFPAWFTPGTPGPYDWLGLTHKPLELATGGYPPSRRWTARL